MAAFGDKVKFYDLAKQELTEKACLEISEAHSVVWEDFEAN